MDHFCHRVIGGKSWWSTCGGGVLLALLVSLWPVSAPAAPASAQPEGPTRPEEQQRTVGLQFSVRVAGTREPLVGARVSVVPEHGIIPWRSSRRRLMRTKQPLEDDPAWIRTAESDEDGRVELAALPLAGSALRVIVNTPGYERAQWLVRLPPPEDEELELFVRRAEYGEGGYRTVVDADRAKLGPAEERIQRRSVSREEIESLPGSHGDPLRAVQNMPGAGRAPAGLGMTILRGASPNASAIYVDHHPVPRSFHVLALAGILPRQAVSDVQLYPGAFSPRYGGSIAGMLGLRTRTPRRSSTVHGDASLDLLGIAASVEAPVGKKSALLVAARRSHMDAVLELADNAHTLRPSYYDYQVFLARQQGSRTNEIKAFGSHDALQAPAGAGDLSFGAGFHRVDFNFERTHGRHRFLVSPSFRIDHSQLTKEPENRRRRLDLVGSWRAEYEARFSDRAGVTLGTDAQLDRFMIEQSEVWNDGEEDPKGTLANIGLYNVWQLRLGAWTFNPGVRLSSFTISDHTSVAIDPRGSLSVEPSSRVRFEFVGGLYSRSFVPTVSSTTGAIGRLPPYADGRIDIPFFYYTYFEQRFGEPTEVDDVIFAQRRQVAGGPRLELPWELELEASAFLRTGENLSGDRFRAYGGELGLRRASNGRFYGWLGYSLLWSTIEREGEEPRPTTFDQRHGFIAILSMGLARGWRLGARFRLASGFPYTPIVAGHGNEIDGYAPIRGEPASERYPLFHQLDLRIDKRWTAKRVSVSTYVDVQNVYNHIYTEMYVYTNDLQHRVGGLGLPIFPTLGVSVAY